MMVEGGEATRKRGGGRLQTHNLVFHVVGRGADPPPLHTHTHTALALSPFRG